MPPLSIKLLFGLITTSLDKTLLQAISLNTTTTLSTLTKHTLIYHYTT